MANHFAHQFSKIMPAAVLTSNSAEALRREVVPAILARMKLSAAFYFGFSPYRRDREKTFRRLLLEKPNGGSPRNLVGEHGRQDVAAKFRVVFEAVCDEWAARQNLDRARLPLRVHPSEAEETYVDVLYEPVHPSGRVFLLYTLGAPARHFWFESQGALEEALWNLYQTLDAERQWAHRALVLSNASPWIVRLHRWYAVLQNLRRGLRPAR